MQVCANRSFDQMHFQQTGPAYVRQSSSIVPDAPHTGTVVLLQGMPKHLCTGPMLEVILEQADLDEAVVKTQIRTGTSTEQCVDLLLDFASRSAAERCVRHFDGRAWNAGNKPVKASFTASIPSEVVVAGEDNRAPSPLFSDATAKLVSTIQKSLQLESHDDKPSSRTTHMPPQPPPGLFSPDPAGPVMPLQPPPGLVAPSSAMHSMGRYSMFGESSIFKTVPCDHDDIPLPPPGLCAPPPGFARVVRQKHMPIKRQGSFVSEGSTNTGVSDTDDDRDDQLVVRQGSL